MSDTLSGTMRHSPQQQNSRWPGLSGLSAMSLLLAAVIVLTSTPAILAGGIADPTDPISRVGSQLRRLAAAVPVRLVAKSPKRDQHRPDAVLNDDAWTPRIVTNVSLEMAVRMDGPAVAPLPVHVLDLPPPCPRA